MRLVPLTAYTIQMYLQSPEFLRTIRRTGDEKRLMKTAAGGRGGPDHDILEGSFRRRARVHVR